MTLSAEATKTLALMNDMRTAIRASYHATQEVREELLAAGMTYVVSEYRPGVVCIAPTTAGKALAAKLSA